MLILCLFLFAAVFMRNTGCAADLTQFVRKEGDIITPSCVGKGDDRYEGIGWIYPIPEDGILPEEETFYLPGKVKNDYDCKFASNNDCTSNWAMKNWDIDTNTTRRYDFISDERWNDFPIHNISKATKEFENRIDIPNVFELGFSVRASEQFNILVCEGWNPKKYSCYNFNVTTREVVLNKQTAKLGNNIDVTNLDSYQAFSDIFAIDEWKNFQLKIDENGLIQIKDVNLNRIMIKTTDKYPLRSSYLFYESFKPSLWKIHYNEFFYTKIAQTSRLGPTLLVNSEDLCVNIHLSRCPNCSMTFFMIDNGTKVDIQQKELRKSGDWSLMRLTSRDVKNFYVNLFMTNSYIPNAVQEGGFWAIDDVRVCDLNEVKISRLKELKLKTESDIEGVSCHVIDKPNLRPKKVVSAPLSEYPYIESKSDSKSINLTWTENTKQDVEYYFSYQANDICTEPPFNTRRKKSNGFLVTKSNQVSLKNLVPYTHYNIEVTSMLHPVGKHLTSSTKEWSYVTLEEQASRVRIENLTETNATISWDEVDCRNIHGHIFYDLWWDNGTHLGVHSENKIILSGLQPFTNYTLHISTVRSLERSYGKRANIIDIRFRTKPGLASVPRNLEIYSRTNNSVSIRYDLPESKQGIPISVHLIRCNPLVSKKCKSFQLPITRCKAYPDKYCVDAKMLIPKQRYIMRFSLKNDGSHTYGPEATIEGVAEERVPGKPTNITYKVMGCDAMYCNLTVNWIHPYDQNGTITSFGIVLRGEGVGKEGGSFRDTYELTDGNYQPQYSHHILKIPFSKKYELYIQSVNKDLKSPLTTPVVVHTPHLGDLIDQSPLLLKTQEDSLEFELKPSDPRLSTTLTIIVQDYNESQPISKEITDRNELVDNLCNDAGDTWISQTIKIDGNKRTITIGQSDPSGKPLQPSTEYCISFLMDNEYMNSSQINAYFERIQTLAYAEKSTNFLLILIVAFIIFVLVGALIFWYLKTRKGSKRKNARNLDVDEHAYESLPFEDNVVNNNLYNRLQHK